MNRYFTIESKQKTADDLTWEKAADLWAGLYLLYDENETHMDDTFYNNGFDKKTAAGLHQEALALAKIMLDMGYDYADDKDLDPELRAIFDEASKTM